MANDERTQVKIWTWANLLTSLRIIFSMMILYCEPLTMPFFIFYTLAGVTDMVDGTVARLTDSVTDFGSKLDTIADLVLVIVCIIKLFPVLYLESWMYVWIIGIALIKIYNMAYCIFKIKRFVPVHSKANKAVGFLLFALPYSLGSIEWQYSEIVILVVALMASIQETFIVKALCKRVLTDKNGQKDYSKSESGE